MDKDKLLLEFKKYVDKFDFNDKMINMKYYHSLRVMKLALKIAISLNFNDNDREICEVAGLLHDYGRFEQWTKYHTFKDYESIDHGDLAVSLLFENNDIEKYYDVKANYDELFDAIKYHNKYKVSDEISKHNQTICDVIRDADKIDIFEIIVNKEVDIKISEQPISPEVQKTFYQHKTINYKDCKNINDEILLYFAMLFELKSDYAKKYIVDNHILDRLYDNIGSHSLFKEYYDYLKKYLTC